ncbi:Nramp family divalent metal transporter [Isoptericola variabilis]|uniref:Natural resistance-associated macrophage protein n=1 Tax=Isoptericola variabilis (strain 225) TaxID=743718 RepID=F6FX44_ISOV2|nr:Nramp family divalent metal transporter [Isoptericola variabilis]AEG44644.1 natural resistance-associated macrophage protein [Isoptericola variabilis 225]TWH28335.1 NRAMP (natural resistance-associated macrophage protein)-like metal ion transporter [Isoptericola variabilis J7]
MSERRMSTISTHVHVPTAGPETMIEGHRRRRTLWQGLALAGPAFVAGAWQFGPGNLTTAVQAGSGYQYTLIWVIAVSTILMIFLTDMSVRLGINTPVSLISSIKDHLGPVTGMVAGVGVFLITLMFSVGNATGSGLALSMMLGGPPVMWTVICSLAVGAILVLRNVYRVIERVLVVTVALMSISFVASAFIAAPDWSAAAAGLIPEVPADAELLVVALVGTNLSVNAAFFTAYGTKARNRTADEYRDTTLADTIPGIVAPGIMTALVIMVAASVLGHTGQAADSLPALAGVFEPLAGTVGATIFAVGFFGAAFSSMIANATAGGTMLSDALGRGPSSGSPTAKVVSGFILAFGVTIALIFQASPVGLIVIAQALTVLVAPVLALLIIIMSSRRDLMGNLRNRWWQNIFGTLALVAVLALSVRLVITLTAG